MVNVEVAQKLMRCFPHSFINENFEFIACRENNLYFMLTNCESELDVKCKVLEWFSRDCFKSMCFRSSKKNNEYHERILECVNDYLGTAFTQDDMDKIYGCLGNAIHHDLTIKFIESGYDMEVLK